MATSLCRGLSFVNAQLLIAGPSLRRRTAAGRQRQHAKDTHAIVQRQRDDIAHAHLFGRFLDALAVDAHVARLDHRLGERAALDQANEEKEAVDPHFFLSLASSAKAWLAAVRRASREGLRPRHFHASPERVNPTSSISRATASSE